MMSPRLLLAGFLGLLLLAPMVVSEFHVTLLNYIGLYAIVTLGLVLLTGVGGLMSFGQAAFVGLGAYTTAYLSVGEGLPGWASMPWAVRPGLAWRPG
jgi:branched-chain amino acid transport system ATP-binding protein